MGGITNDTPGGMVLDASGNLYLTGTFTSAVADFDPGAGVSNLTKQGSIDTWLASYDNSGNYRWSFSIGSTSSQVSANKVTLAPGGFLYITGSVWGTNPTDFDPGAGAGNLTPIGNGDAFVAKYTTAGAYSNAFLIGSTTGAEIGYGIGADASGNIYVTGKFEGVTDFNPSPSVANNLTSLGYGDVFLAKYNSAGVYQFAKGIGTAAGSEQANTLVVDAAGNPVIAGYYSGTMDADPNAGVTNIVSNGSWVAS